jgi:hypothetical protein
MLHRRLDPLFIQAELKPMHGIFFLIFFEIGSPQEIPCVPNVFEFSGFLKSSDRRIDERLALIVLCECEQCIYEFYFSLPGQVIDNLYFFLSTFLLATFFTSASSRISMTPCWSSSISSLRSMMRVPLSESWYLWFWTTPCPAPL